MFQDFFIKDLQRRLEQLSEGSPQRVEAIDDEGAQFTLSVDPQGDIHLSVGIWADQKMLRFTGPGGGQSRPLTRLVLRLLLQVLDEEYK